MLFEIMYKYSIIRLLLCVNKEGMDKIMRMVFVAVFIAVTIYSVGVSAAITTIDAGSLEFQQSVGRHAGPGSLAGSHGLRRFVLCVDGLKILQTVGPAAGWGGGVGFSHAVSTVQLYEERDGKALPAKCISQ
ncbi:MAG: hypothetical protein GY814_12755 [Gammaproteobacteria bacterium]|nr:hypothetical protein [Gammaproteobacteria bacterium]